MKSLADDNGNLCKSEDDKLQALVSRNFFTKDQEPVIVEVDDEGCRYSVEELEVKAREVLRGTSSRSASGPDGISYRLIKAVLDTRLGREITRKW